MRWLIFAALVFVAVVLQTTLAWRVAVFNARPDWIFVLVVFFALYARRDDAYLAGWLLGVCADLMSIERFGLLAVSFGTVAMLIHSVRHALFAKHATTHFAVTLIAALLLHSALGVYRFVAEPHSALARGGVIGEGVFSALYTALWAIPIHHSLLGMAPALGLHTSRYSHQDLNRPNSGTARSARV